MYFSFGSAIGGFVDVSFIFVGIVDLLGSPRVFFEAAFVIYSEILFPTRSPDTSIAF